MWLQHGQAYSSSFFPNCGGYGTREVLQEPDISDTTDLLLSKPELAEVQLELPVGTGLTLELQQRRTHHQLTVFY